jgi:hypothetical protein
MEMSRACGQIAFREISTMSSSCHRSANHVVTGSTSSSPPGLSL